MVRGVSSKTGVGKGSVVKRLESLAELYGEAKAKNKQKRQHVANVTTDIVDDGITHHGQAEDAERAGQWYSGCIFDGC